MIEATQGIVLHTLKYGETSMICRIYTEKFGLISYIVNGVRSAKSIGKAVLLQPGNILDLQVYNRENKNLQYIKEYKLAFIYEQISHNIVKTSVCLFVLELLNNTIKEHETNEQLYHFIIESLLHLDKVECVDASFPPWFMIQLSKQIGYEPGNDFDDEHPFFSLKEGLFHENKHDEHAVGLPYSQYWYLILQQDLPENMYKENAERKTMLDSAQKYFQYHVESFKPLRSPAILHEVLS